MRLSIAFPTAGATSYPGTLGTKPVKGIGPGCLAAIANIDFTACKSVQVPGGGQYAACFLDYSTTTGVADKIDSIRSVVVDNTLGTLSSAPVYIISPDTQNVIVAPSNAVSTFRAITNVTQLYAYQEAQKPSQVRMIACNYDIPGEFVSSEFLNGPLGQDRLIATKNFSFVATGSQNIVLGAQNNYFIDYILFNVFCINAGANLTFSDPGANVAWYIHALQEQAFRVDLAEYFSGGATFSLAADFLNDNTPNMLVGVSVSIYGQGF